MSFIRNKSLRFCFMKHGFIKKDRFTEISISKMLSNWKGSKGNKDNETPIRLYSVRTNFRQWSCYVCTWGQRPFMLLSSAMEPGMRKWWKNIFKLIMFKMQKRGQERMWWGLSLSVTITLMLQSNVKMKIKTIKLFDSLYVVFLKEIISVKKKNCKNFCKYVFRQVLRMDL